MTKVEASGCFVDAPTFPDAALSIYQLEYYNIVILRVFRTLQTLSFAPISAFPTPRCAVSHSLHMAKKKAKRDPIDFVTRVITRGDLTRRDGTGRFVFLGVEDVAMELGIAKSEVLSWLKTGAVPHFVLDNRVVFHRSELPGNEVPSEEAPE